MKDLTKLLEDSLAKLKTALMLSCKYDAGCAEEVDDAIDCVAAALLVVENRSEKTKTS